MKTLRRWNYETKQYEDFKIPKGKKIVLYTTSMERKINCSSCFKETEYGVCFTSLEIHDFFGFGYPVCKDCYSEEYKRKRENKG